MQPTDAMRDAICWLVRHEGSGVFVKTWAGGLQFLACGDIAPFMHITIMKLVNVGWAVATGPKYRSGVRVTVTEAGYEIASRQHNR